MSKLSEIIKNERKGIITSTKHLVIEQTLNNLFYAPPNPKEELRMLKMQYKQCEGDRIGLHASAIIADDKNFCFREQVLSLFFKMCQGNNISVHTKRVFMEGTFIGEKWQRLFIRGGLGTPENMDISRFVEQYDLSYTPDISPVYIAKIPYVIEVKSMNTFKFKKCKSHPSGQKQLMIYQHFEKIKNGFVLVEDKNDQSFKVFLQEYDKSVVQPYLDRLDEIQVLKRRFIKLGKPPARLSICDKSDCKRAQSCGMREACWNVGMGRIKL